MSHRRHWDYGLAAHEPARTCAQTRDGLEDVVVSSSDLAQGAPTQSCTQSKKREPKPMSWPRTVSQGCDCHRRDRVHTFFKREWLHGNIVLSQPPSNSQPSNTTLAERHEIAPKTQARTSAMKSRVLVALVLECLK